MSTPADLVLSREGSFDLLILSRAERRNALTLAQWQSLPAILARLALGDGRGLMIQGAGGHFAAGADISEFVQVHATPTDSAGYFRAMADAMNALADFPKPVIAKINGACVGAGMAIALCADFRWAADDARFGITPAKLGLTYSLEDTRRLVAIAGLATAKDLLLTGRLLDAAEAKTLGLIDAIYPAAELAGAVGGLARTLTENSAWTLRSAKQIFQRLSAGQTRDDVATLALQIEAASGPDFHEGQAAFLAKRKPSFTSR